MIFNTVVLKYVTSNLYKPTGGIFFHEAVINPLCFLKKIKVQLTLS